jgi:hypothetical protein
VGVVSHRATAGAVEAGELVELRVDDLALRPNLHALWLSRRPAPLAAELLSIAQRTGGAKHELDPRIGALGCFRG